MIKPLLVIPTCRIEEDNWFSFPIFGTTDVFGINKIGLELLSLCNGKNDIEIIISEMKKKYNELKNSDIEKSLFYLRNMNIVYFNCPKEKQDNYVLDEKYLKEVSFFIKKNMTRFINLLFKNNILAVEDRIWFLSTFKYEYYQSWAFRQRLEKGIQDVFFYRNSKGEVEGICIVDYYDEKANVVISGFIFDDYFINKINVEKFLNFSIDNINRLVKNNAKIHINVPIVGKSSKDFKNILKKQNFLLEGILKKECFGQDMELWSRLN